MKKRFCFPAFLLILVIALQSPLSVFAAAVSSPTNSGTPSIVEGTDDNGQDLLDPAISDILVITPYTKKQEMQQEYKQDNLELAMGALTWEAAETALKDEMTPEMNPRKLTAVSVFYVHEKNDNGIVELPANIRITTPLKKGAYAKVICFAPRIGFLSAKSEPSIVLLSSFTPDHSDHEWVCVPSQLNDDGTISFTVDYFTSYAIITYVAQETPGTSDPSQPTVPGGTTIPHSPQTGEPDMPYTSILAAALFAAAIALSRRSGKKAER